MAEYASKPTQFRLPEPVLDFLARESAESGVSKTEVVVRALEAYENELYHERLGRAYAECAEYLLEETLEWDAGRVDSLEGWDW